MMDPTIAEVVFSLLQERYAQGRKDGYDKAMAELKDALAAIEVPLPATALSATAWPVVEPKGAAVKLPPNADDLKGSVIKRALAFLTSHPGARYSDVKREIGNGTAIYQLVKLGYAEKRDGAFYPK